MNPKIRRLIIIIIVSILLFLASLYLHFHVITAKASTTSIIFQDPSYCIHGKVYTPKAEGRVHIYLINEELFQVPNSGLETLIKDVKSTTLEYKFPPVATGTYGIRCFQDLNGNGKLDKGILGPKEPWALTWTTERRFPPRFQDISFHLVSDTLIQLSLSK